MEDFEDIIKINDVIKKNKAESQNPDEIEYPEFIDYDDVPNEVDEQFEVEEYDIPNFTKTDITKFNTYAPSQFLTDNEKKVVDSCTDPVLKELLLLNRTKNIQLMQLYRKIKDLLMECQENIVGYEKKFEERHPRKLHPRIWRLGIPYFKTADRFPCVRNPDIVRKHQNGELFFYDMTKSFKWTDKEMNRLLKGVAFQYKIKRETEMDKLAREIASKKYKLDPNNKERIQDLTTKLEDITNSMTATYPPVGCEKYIDWTQLSEMFFKEKFSAQDCQIFWNIYLHPSINKKPWTSEENNRLKILAEANNYQNWDHIAKEFGNNRTGFLACVHYYCKVSPPIDSGRFSPEEDKRLIDLVEHYRQGDYIPWTKITHHFEARIRAQLFSRYKYFLKDRENIDKGKFTLAEDILILVLVDRFGKRFSKCGKYFPNRSVAQIKARYTSNLKGAIKKGFFTIEEDRKILDFVKKQGTGNWIHLVDVLKRSGGQIRQRYNTLMTFQLNNPNADLAQAPRRRYSGIAFNTEFDYSRLMADKFKNYKKIPTLKDIQGLLDCNPKPEPEPLIRLNRAKSDSKKYSKICQREKIMFPKPSSNKDLAEQANNNETSGSQTEAQNNTLLLLKTEYDKDAMDFPSLVIDDLITDYFSTSMTLKFGQSARNEHLSRAANVVSNILSILQAELYIPKNFAEDPRLDAIDVEILDILKEDKPITINDEYVMKRDSLYIERMIPPNLNTMVAMRSLLIKNQVYKNKCAKREQMSEDFRKEDMEKQILWCINSHLSNQSRGIRLTLIMERNLFFKRFLSLFKFPAIMSLVEPSELLQESAKEEKKHTSKVLRTYQKRSKAPATKSTAPQFEGVFIKQSEQGNCEIQTVPVKITETRKTNESKISKRKSSSEAIRVKTGYEGTLKLSMVDQLKMKINQTIHDLKHSSSGKRAYQTETKYIKPEERRITKPLTVEKIANIGTVIDDVQKTKKRRLNEMPETCKQALPEKQVVPEPRQIRTYMPKPKTKTIITEISIPGRTIAKKTEKATVTKIVNKVNSHHEAESRSNFNLGRGELILERNSPSTSSTRASQDVLDLQLLNDVLKKEKTTTDEETFDF